MAQAGIVGIHRRIGRGCTKRDPECFPGRGPGAAQLQSDRAGPAVGDGRDRAPDRGGQGLPGRRARCLEPAGGRAGRSPITSVPSWSSTRIQMAIWRRRPPAGRTVAHSDHGSTYTSWAFGRRLRAAGLLGSMGSIGDCFDNSAVESFFGTLQIELLDEHRWDTRKQLALAMFDWIEAWYNPSRRHSYCGMLSPVDYERAHTSHRSRGMITTTNLSAGPGEPHSTSALSCSVTTGPPPTAWS